MMHAFKKSVQEVKYNPFKGGQGLFIREQQLLPVGSPKLQKEYFSLHDHNFNKN